MQKTFCDGCQRPTTKIGDHEHVISGSRVNGLHGGDIPSGDFDLCWLCARIGFRAISVYWEAARTTAQKRNGG